MLYDKPITDWYQVFPNSKVFRHPLRPSDAQKLVYLRDRVRFAEKKCAQDWKPDFENTFLLDNVIFYDKRKKMGYCHVAKAGSTFWGRVFTFLTRTEELKSKGIQNMFQISKINLHAGGSFSPTLKQTGYWFNKSVVKKWTLKFFFTRNPYSRLWSVYLDKFYLLGQWDGQGRSARWCTDYDSFQSFLETSLKSNDHHVQPISELCNPCLFRPHVIGRMETFGVDAEFILNQTLYRHMLLEHFSHQFHVAVEINATIDSNFVILHEVRLDKKVCLDEKALCQRLWRVFQYQGYISNDIDFPNDRIDYSKEAMTPVFLKAASNSAMTSQKSKEQKNHNLIQAYKRISPETIYWIKNRYLHDFELFNYDPNPPS